MRDWARAIVASHCGLCGALVEAGTPVVVVKIPNVKRERVRCVACVGEAPPELPPLVKRSPRVNDTMTRIGR